MIEIHWGGKVFTFATAKEAAAGFHLDEGEKCPAEKPKETSQGTGRS